MSEEEYLPGPDFRNYYMPPHVNPLGLKYRLDAGDLLETVVDTLRGGVVRVDRGQKIYKESQRLMNDEGIARVHFYLSTAVSKTAHLTNYKNIERMMEQLKQLSHAFLKELVLNMKVWGPEIIVPLGSDSPIGVLSETVFKGQDNKRYIRYRLKVRNKHLVLQVVENAMLQSMQRGLQGFEAEITGKSWNVNEMVNPYQEAGPQRRGFLSRFFGGGNQNGPAV